MQGFVTETIMEERVSSTIEVDDVMIRNGSGSYGFLRVCWMKLSSDVWIE